jgi:hypothetical protein
MKDRTMMNARENIEQRELSDVGLDLAELDQVCGGGSKLGAGTDGVHSAGSKPGGVTDGIVLFGSKPGGAGDGFF